MGRKREGMRRDDNEEQGERAKDINGLNTEMTDALNIKLHT